MNYGPTTLRSVDELTPEELHFAIGNAAYYGYEIRPAELARADWGLAVPSVKEELIQMGDDQQPTDDQVRPEAFDRYQYRLQIDRMVYCDTAVKRLRSEGNDYPTQAEVLIAAATIAEEKRKALQDLDWYQAEKEAHKLGVVPFPTDMIPEKEKNRP